MRPQTRFASVTVGFQPAEAVARGAGGGAGRARPEAEAARVVDPGDGAAARADLGHVHAVGLEREAALVSADPVEIGRGEAPVLDEARLRAWCRPCRASRPRRCDSCLARSRAPMTPATGPDSTVRTGSRPAVSALSAPPLESRITQLAVEGALAQRPEQRADVAPGRRRHVRVRGRCGEALVLAPLPAQLGGRRDRHAEVGAQVLGDEQLVGRLDVGVQEGDGDRLDLRLPGAARRARRARRRSGAGRSRPSCRPARAPRTGAPAPISAESRR